MRPILFAIFATLSLPATAAEVPLQTVLPICMAQSMDEAEKAGAALNWHKLTEADLADWRESFLDYNGGPLDVVGWRQGEKDTGESVSFWIAGGVNAHRACTYSTQNGEALLTALTDHFGTPESLDRLDFGTTAFWSHDGAEVMFSQVGASAMVNISFTK